MSVKNRYLTLAGAPWSPKKVNGSTTLANYFTFLGVGLLIAGAAEVNPAVEKEQLKHLFAGLVGAGLAVAESRLTRRKEAKDISTKADLLVIDTKPDSSTPPTSPNILTRVNDIKMRYKGGSVFSSRGLKSLALDYGIIIIDYPRLFQNVDKVGMSAFWIGLCTARVVDVLTRHRQLEKIADLKWVITDQGDAVRNYQHENAEKLIHAGGMAVAPIRLER